MSKGIYIGDDSNKARKVKKIYIGDDSNKARLVYMLGYPYTRKLYWWGKYTLNSSQTKKWEPYNDTSVAEWVFVGNRDETIAFYGGANVNDSTGEITSLKDYVKSAKGYEIDGNENDYVGYFVSGTIGVSKS